jgi:ribosome assembly protein 1
MFGNVRSVRNKFDELAANCRFNYEYRTVICLTGTWLDSSDADRLANVDGFNLIRGDRQGTNKHHGGGVCIYVNERWCNNATLKKLHCDDNIELLMISCRPYYMPREFNNIYITVVYIPPDGNFTRATEILTDCVTMMDDNCQDGVNIILGDFNGCDVSQQIPHYFQ